MADWTTIPNGNIETDKPVRAIDGRALRDNPIAIAEGAVGAPRIEDAALDSTVTSAGETWVADRMIARTHGGIGTLAFLEVYNVGTGSGSERVPGVTVSGANLRWAGLVASGNSGNPSGTWRCLGRTSPRSSGSGTENAGTTLWQRIA